MPRDVRVSSLATWKRMSRLSACVQRVLNPTDALLAEMSSASGVQAAAHVDEKQSPAAAAEVASAGSGNTQPPIPACARLPQLVIELRFDGKSTDGISSGTLARGLWKLRLSPQLRVLRMPSLNLLTRDDAFHSAGLTH